MDAMNIPFVEVIPGRMGEPNPESEIPGLALRTIPE
jgi:hypothetical protein